MGAQECVSVCGGDGLTGDVEGCLGGWVPSEVCDYLFCFGCVEMEIIVLAPSDGLGNLLAVVILVIVGDESGYGGVVCVFEK